jgi:BRCT domain type II-containing protein
MLNKNTVFCFTGKSPKPRHEMEAIATKAGASVTKTVTNQTTILVLADMNTQSAKAKRARANGIELIGPQTFFSMCSGTNNVAISKKEVKLEKELIIQETEKFDRKIVL